MYSHPYNTMVKSKPHQFQPQVLHIGPGTIGDMLTPGRFPIWTQRFLALLWLPKPAGRHLGVVALEGFIYGH